MEGISAFMVARAVMHAQGGVQAQDPPLPLPTCAHVTQSRGKKTWASATRGQHTLGIYV
jgi:hypothetical protein